MLEPVPNSQVVRFGIYEVDLRLGELRKNGIRVKLTGQPFQILAILLEHPSDLVTREQLQQRLWPSDTFVDFDRSLNTAINRVREALGDSAENPRFVETLPRRGYRFIAEVQSPSNRLTPGTLGERPRVEQAVAPHTGPRRWTWMLTSSALAVILLIGAVLGLKFSPRSTERPHSFHCGPAICECGCEHGIFE